MQLDVKQVVQVHEESLIFVDVEEQQDLIKHVPAFSTLIFPLNSARIFFTIPLTVFESSVSNSIWCFHKS